MNMNTNLKVIISCLAIICAAGITVFLSVRNNRERSKTTEDTTVTESDTAAIKRVHNLIILDESGSMSGLEKVSVAGVNETIRTIREAYHENHEQEQLLTVVTFSGQPGMRMTHHYNSLNIKEVEEMATNTFNPNGVTPLWDAMGNMCTRIEKEIDAETLVLVTIITDGMENASTEYNHESIKTLVDRLDKAGWVFTYIGANQDAVYEANSMDIRNALQYDSDEEGTKAMWDEERNSRKAFYSRTQTIKSRSQLKRGYFEDDKE